MKVAMISQPKETCQEIYNEKETLQLATFTQKAIGLSMPFPTFSLLAELLSPDCAS